MENQKGLVELAAEKTWNFLSSVKLAVVLLIILAIVSVIGTIIQQNQAPEQYLQEYSQSTVVLFEKLGFFDMYHTWWYVLLLFLLTANLTVCTLERFPHTWKIVTSPLKPIEEDGLKALPFKKEITLTGGIEKVEEHASKTLAAHRYRFVNFRTTDSSQLAGQKGLYSRFGVYITHASILLIFTGALIGAFFGFKAFLNLPEGAASNVVYLRNEPMWDRIMDSFGIAESPVIQSQDGVPAMPIGFYVRCDSFDVDYYVNAAGRPTGMPSEYHSLLSVFDKDGQKLYEKRIRVNDPLTHHGITFYQSSYGNLPDQSGAKIVLNIVPKNNQRAQGETIVLDPGKSLYVPSIDRTIKALAFAPYGIKNPDTGQVMFYQTENRDFVNPTVEIEVLKGTKSVFKTFVMKTEPVEPYMPEDYVIRFVQYWGARYTGLQVAKDPGVWVVYSGFILLCIGPLIAFFGSHRKVWVRIKEEKGRSVITLAGSANRNRIAFEREFNRIAEELGK